MQPEEIEGRVTLKERLGSKRFAYNGRTQFQSRMAATLRDRPANSQMVQRSDSARLANSTDDIGTLLGDKPLLLLCVLQ